MTVAEYMAECLTNPVDGYYTTRDPLGAAGDFTTAPEITQMFGEILGLCLAQAWLDRGAPAPFVLAELGPGRGSLIADLMRATKAVPGFHASMRLNLVEVSPALRARQAEALAEYDPAWCDRPEDLPGGPLFLVANEFFDALPVRQFVRQGPGWSERVVGITDDRLAIGLTPPASLALLEHRLTDTQDGDLVEHSATSEKVVAGISGRIAREGGVALVVDYGCWRSLGDTLQAVRGNAPADPLAAPGETDLTAHVDFEALARAAHSVGAMTSAMTRQGLFLERLGITSRAQALARKMSGDALDAHVAAHRRLTHPDEMGDLFKVMAIFAKDTPLPPGLDQ